MIVTKPKPFSEIIGSLGNERVVFIVGCSECASVCKTGGEQQVNDLKEKLEREGKTVSGFVVLSPGCSLMEAKKEFRKAKEAIGRADSLIVMSCGGGVQIAQEASAKPVHSATNTMFLGTMKRVGSFQEYCSMCGECVLDMTGGICPATRCAKGLLNGPCGGAKEGKCEVNPDLDCAWIKIYDRLKEMGKLARFMDSQVQVRDYSVRTKPATLVVDRVNDSQGSTQ
jgi:ferredoxin